MEQLHCPHCESSQIDKEDRLVASDRSTSIGRWRLKYGLISALVAAIFGLLCLIAVWRWLDPPLDEPALLIGIFAFIFSAFVLGTTVAFSRWTHTTQYRCRVCNLTWIEETDQ